LVVDNTVYASGAYTGDGLVAVDATQGTTQWKSAESGPGFDIIHANGYLYSGGTDSAYCLDATTGETQWSFTTDKIISEPLAINDSEAYVVSENTLYALTEEF